MRESSSYHDGFDSLSVGILCVKGIVRKCCRYECF